MKRAAGVHEEQNVFRKRFRVDADDFRDKEGDVLHRTPAARFRAFRTTVWNYWNGNGRHDLPWRKTKNPYKILVSEVMLQQTQVARVIEKYDEFLKAFPNVKSLARSGLAEVLKVWSGMGYNRRAKFLRDAANIIVEKHGGKIPRDFAALRSLPGVGDYTAKAVRVFAFNEPEILIETNIRAAYINYFFASQQGRSLLARTVLAGKGVTDAELVLIGRETVKRQDPRQWNWALMDYGAYVKKVHENPTRRSVHYGMQSKFEGSVREARGAILKILTEGSHGDLALAQKLHFDGMRVRKALTGLASDGLIVAEKGSWRIA